VQLLQRSLLQFITTPRFPGKWHGTSYGFVLHWKEQVAQYEKLELESFLHKHKLRMLQNSVSDFNEFAYVKQLGEQDIARVNPLLDFGKVRSILSWIQMESHGADCNNRPRCDSSGK
jgi:hypothetical protein